MPTPVETVLLPFKGKIIYDSFINSMQVGFAASARKMIREMYDRVKEPGITTSLE